MPHLLIGNKHNSEGIERSIRPLNSLVVTLGLCLAFFPVSAYAKGVAAGVSIENTAIVNYRIDGMTQSPIESTPQGNTAPGLGQGEPTRFVVDRKIDLALTGNSNANVNPGDTQAEVTFTLTNEGNDNQEFSLIPDTTLTNDDFDSQNCAVIATGVSGTPLPGVTVPASGNIQLKADQSAEISVRCDIPFDNDGEPILSGQNSLLSLFATAEKNGDGTVVSESKNSDQAGLIETVFADSAGSDDIPRDASHSARRTYTAASSTVAPELILEKSIASVKDPEGGSDAVSGAEVTYKISINSRGTGFIDNLIVTDETPEGMQYKAGSMRLDNSLLSDAADSDVADFGITKVQTATIQLGSILAGKQHDIELTFVID